MARKIKTLIVLGTRPEAIKVAKVIKTLKADPNFAVTVVSTGQHREMLDQVLELFAITPDVDLGIMKPSQTLTDITRNVLGGLEEVFRKIQPDIVLVHGDTSTAFSSALSAFYHGLKVGHIEAGLRSFTRREPFPEEINRRLISQLADLHFAPTPVNKANLILEGTSAESIYVTGNTVIDSLLEMVEEGYNFQNPVLQSLDFSKRTLLAEIHRRENLEKLEEIYSGLLEIVERFVDVQLIYSVHPNPRVKEAAVKVLGGKPRIHLIDPPAYKEWVNLMKRSYLILTDSGGLQEEAPSLGVPVLVIRDVTERTEGVRAGTLRLIGSEKESVVRNAAELLTSGAAYESMRNSQNPYGDGNASLRIKEALLHCFLQAKKPQDYIAL